MAVDLSVIKSYLVELGFKTDQHQLHVFQEGMKKAASIVGEATGGMTKSFLLAGAAVTGTLTAMAAGTVAMALHVAKTDLDMQLFARRMFLSTDAARKLKTATDALGVSMEEIVFGPPELRERYHQLLMDQDKMLKALGGTDFEKQMRNIRDVRFEFTRFGVEMQYFAMFFVKDLSKALFGDENGLLRQLRRFNDWFQEKMPLLADRMATEIAPAFHDLGRAAAHLWESLSKIDWAKLLTDIIWITKELIKLLDYLVSHPNVMKLLTSIGGGAVLGSALGPEGTVAGAAAGAVFGGGWILSDQFAGGGGPLMGKALKADMAARAAAQKIAQKLKINPAWVYGQFVHETGNFSHIAARNNLAGIRWPGSTKYRDFATTQDFADYYADLISRRYPGAAGAATDADYFRALKSGGYYEDTYDNYLRGSRAGEGRYAPMSMHVQGGSVTVNVQGSADTAALHATVKRAVKEANDDMVAQLITQSQGVFA